MRTVVVFASALVVLVVFHVYWSGTFIKRYEPWLFFAVYNTIGLVIAWLVNVYLKHPNFKTYLVSGVVFGYILSLLVHVGLESSLVSFTLSNFANAYNRDPILAIKILLLFPFIQAGWLQGIIWAVAIYFASKKGGAH